MSKYEKRLEARYMRENGLSIKNISKKLKVSSSSVSLWCRDITLTYEQLDKLKINRALSLKNGLKILNKINRDKKLKTIKDSGEWAKKKINKTSKRDLLILSTGLYWAEGSKTDNTSTIMFINSDPEMICIMKKFYICVLNVKKEDIAIRIQINIQHKYRIDRVLNFWRKLLELESGQIRRPYFVKTKSRKVYDNHDNYYGVCRLFVVKGKHLQYKMIELIKTARENILSA